MSTTVLSTTVQVEGTNRVTTYPNESPSIMPSPLQAVLGALANCKIVTLQHHAGANKMTIEKVIIECQGKYDTQFFSGTKKETNTEKNTFSEINIKVSIKTDADKTKVEEIMNTVAECCPVYNTLKLAGIPINTEIKYL